MKQGFLKKCLIPGLGREKCKMSLVHLMLSTDKEGSAQKKKKRMGLYVKRTLESFQNRSNGLKLGQFEQ
jgi:hypothetical protein